MIKKLIAIYPDDCVFLRTEFRKRYLARFPEVKGVTITDAFLIHKLVSALKGEWNL